MKYYIAGNRGLVGKQYANEVSNSIGGNTSTVDYTDSFMTYSEFQRLHTKDAMPTHVIINAATVGGLQEDLDKSYELMIKNLTIQNNLFNVCSQFGIDRVLLQGSTCSYPAVGNQPFTEDQLMNGEPFKTYLPTAMPKLMGMYQCRAKNEKAGTHWRTAINSNMFGPGDRTGEHAHVMGALMQKFVTAVKEDQHEIEIWGSGNQSRDFIYIKDAVRAMDMILNNDKYDTVNVASGVETSIKTLAETLKKISGFKGKLWYNTNRPEGILNRSIDNSRLKELGWEPKYTLEEALTETYRWYYDNS
jgi:nucleoside-diphosphate-sugar epimerase